MSARRVFPGIDMGYGVVPSRYFLTSFLFRVPPFSGNGASQRSYSALQCDRPSGDASRVLGVREPTSRPTYEIGRAGPPDASPHSGVSTGSVNSGKLFAR